MAEHHVWRSPRLEREIGVRVYGRSGAPILAFPTGEGDEWQYERQGVVESLGRHLDEGRIRLFCVATIDQASWYDKTAHPRHRSYLQAMYDAYVAEEVVPFVQSLCGCRGAGIAAAGPELGAYHAVNSLLKHPQSFRRCIALSGLYDLRRFMDGDYDDNFYFNNPVDYVTGLGDPWYLEQLAQDDIRLVTGSGSDEDPRPTWQLSGVLWSRGIRHAVDDWGVNGGHDWPFWNRQLEDYIGRLY